MNIRFSGFGFPVPATRTLVGPPQFSAISSPGLNTNPTDRVTFSGAAPAADNVDVERMTTLLTDYFGDLSDPNDPDDPDFIINPHTTELLCDLVNGGADKTAPLPLETLTETVFPVLKEDATVKSRVALSGFDVLRVLREMTTNSLFADEEKKAAFLERLDQKDAVYYLSFQKDVAQATIDALNENELPADRQSVLEALEGIGINEFPKEDVGRALWQQGYDPLTVDAQLVDAAMAVMDLLG